MRRPNIGYRIVRGLKSIYSLASTHAENGDCGEFLPEDLDDVTAALDYLGRLITWRQEKQKNNSR
jgi:hypothetical protein